MMRNKVIACTTIDVHGVPVDVSTVDLGLIGPRGYETMLFVDSDPTHNLNHKLIDRYNSQEQAEAGHSATVAKLREGL